MYQLLRVEAVHPDEWAEYRRFFSDQARPAGGKASSKRGRARDSEEDYRVTQTYSNCRFFSVRSRHEIRELVLGEPQD